MSEIAVRRVAAALRALAAIGFASGISLAVYAWSIGNTSVGPALIVIVLPAILVWFRPNARSVGIWAGFAWFSALMLLLSYNPYGENEVITRWLDVLLPGLLAALPIAGYGASALTAERPVGELAPLARKLRSIAAVTFVLAIVLIAIGFLPGESIDQGEHTSSAGGMGLVVLLAVAVSPGFPVYTLPTRAHGWRWTLLALGLGLPGSALLTFDFRLTGTHVDVERLWPRHVVELGIGTLLALLLLVLPLVLLTTRGDDDPPQTTLPPARMV